ncbi:PI-PLC X domain-containing protein 1 isoform X2 [Brachyistius frenatus]
MLRDGQLLLVHVFDLNFSHGVSSGCWFGRFSWLGVWRKQQQQSDQGVQTPERSMSSVVASGLSEPSLAALPMESWMSHLPCALWDTPLYHLAIPGSHNAITYCLDMNDRSPVDLTQPDMLQKLDKYMKPLIRPFVYKWAITQEYTIKQQLDCGVRYCDLRIAHRPNDSSTDLYFYHGVYTTLTVETVLMEIREWLDAHPREVVILSFSHFLGLSQELHMLLLTTIRNVFTSKLCDKAEALTLRRLWALGHQVIVSYEHNIASCHSELWPHIPYWWANKCKAESLIEEFEDRKQHGRPGGFFVTGINLTEDLKYICTHPTESLKDLVMSTYPTLLGWVKEQTPGSKVGSLNIIAGDFVTESHFVPTVVTLNQKLLKWSS